MNQGEFSGYASLFDKKDMDNDIVLKGAFKKSLLRKPACNVRMLFQHDPKTPIGSWIDIHEDKRGLWAHGRLNLEVARARELHSLLSHGGIDGLSIGFKAREAKVKNGVRHLIEIDLWEISIVTFPMLNGARVKLI
jgi:uncharacterized protein